jgi:hypothetical protein
VFGLTDNEPHWLFALASVMLNKTLSMPNQGQCVCLTLQRREAGIPRPILNDRRSSQVHKQVLQ